MTHSHPLAVFTGTAAAFTAERRPLSRQNTWPFSPEYPAILMMLAFLVDQVQQMSCHLFQAALKELGSKRALWEMMRNYFRMFRVDSMETIFRVLVDGPDGYIVLERDWLGG